jgi:hypothetical protein
METVETILLARLTLFLLKVKNTDMIQPFGQIQGGPVQILGIDYNFPRDGTRHFSYDLYQSRLSNREGSS